MTTEVLDADGATPAQSLGELMESITPTSPERS